MVIPPLIGNPYNGYTNPYYKVDDHPLLYGNNQSLDPIARMYHQLDESMPHHYDPHARCTKPHPIIPGQIL